MPMPDVKKLQRIAKIAEREKDTMTLARWQRLVQEADKAGNGMPNSAEFLMPYKPGQTGRWKW